MNTTKTSRAFTLIELLVVIAVVALLIAVSGPLLGTTRQQAEEAICRSTLKQWALMFTLYAADNEESFPQGITDGVVTPEAAWILGALKPYYEDLDLRDCPSTKSLNRPPANPDSGDRNMGGTFHQWGPFLPTIDESRWWVSYAEGSYGFNDWVADPPPEVPCWGHDSDLAVRTTFEKNAYLIPMVCDAVWVEMAPKMNNLAPSDLEHELDIYDAYWSYNALKFACIDRHSGGINAAFVDMGVRHVGVKELWLLKWNAEWEQCQPPNAWPSWTDIYKDYDYDW